MTGAEILREVLRDLGAFQGEMVFTGGLVLSLYFETEPSTRLRPTYDADAVVACASFTRWAALQADLMKVGIMPVSEPDAPICRMRTPKGYLLDVMPMDPGVLGFGNRWFRPGFERAIVQPLGQGVTIKIFPAPYYAAAKAEAYRDRGSKDPWLSHDLEDLLTLIAYRPSLRSEVAHADADLRAYLASFAAELLALDRFDEIVDAHVPERSDEVLAALAEIAAMATI